MEPRSRIASVSASRLSLAIADVDDGEGRNGDEREHDSSPR